MRDEFKGLDAEEALRVGEEVKLGGEESAFLSCDIVAPILPIPPSFVCVRFK